MDKRSDPWAILAVLIALVALIFGDNIYERITGRTVFAGSDPTIQSSITPPVKVEAPMETSILGIMAVEILDTQGVPMMLIPAGEFTMGRDINNNNYKLTSTVYLDAFYIDKYEVTNALYKRCIDAGKCTFPSNTISNTRSSYFGNSQYDDYPVIYVDWIQAQTYCAWRGGQVPTEAEWEKSARGIDGRTYPWGETIDNTLANYGNPSGDTARVGSYEKGRSPYGVYDMAGNVYEMTADWYKESSSSTLIIRGGDWYVSNEYL